MKQSVHPTAFSVPPLKKPLIVYDGDCEFCRRWAVRGKKITGNRIDYAPFQAVGEYFPGIPKEVFMEAVHLREPGGRVFRGAEAVIRALTVRRELKILLWLYSHFPGFGPFSEWIYQRIARHRVRSCSSENCR